MREKAREGSVALVAFGGNVILKSAGSGSIEEQEANSREMCERLITVLQRGYELVVTHGNGPQVGNLLMQNELAQEVVPTVPLDVLVAQTEGSLGYILQQQLLNEFRHHRIRKHIITMITQVIVDPNDVAFDNPSKPVGPFYSKEEAEKLKERYENWQIAEDSNRGYRRIVPSPMPQKVIQSRMIRSLVYAGNVVLALGGGGVPITQNSDNEYVGVEAVIDKDLSSALLASDVKADLFIILTETEKIYLNFGQENEQSVDKITCEQASAYIEAGHFPPGSMGPKVASAIMYLKAGGREVIITNPANLENALDGKGGTRIVWR